MQSGEFATKQEKQGVLGVLKVWAQYSTAVHLADLVGRLDWMGCYM